MSQFRHCLQCLVEPADRDGFCSDSCRDDYDDDLNDLDWDDGEDES